MRRSSLEDELLRDIGEEAEKIRERARGEGEAVLQRARQERAERRRLVLQCLEEEMDLRRRRVMAREELAGRKALLQLKQEELERVFRDAGERMAEIEKADPGRLDAFWEGIYRACRLQLPPGLVRVRIDRLGSLRQRLAAETDLELVEDTSVRGMTIESIGGRQRCDASLATLLGHLRQEREAEIETLLFGEEHDREGE